MVSRRVLRVSVALGAVVALGWPVSAGARPTVPGPMVGQYDQVLSRSVTGVEQVRDAAKQAAAHSAVSTVLRNTSPASTGALGTRRATAALSKLLGVSYQTQTAPSWCGPTTLAIILGYKGWGWRGSAATQQAAAAKLLGVTRTGEGTPWYGADRVPVGGPWESMYPMQDALNYVRYRRVHSLWWRVHALRLNPTRADVSTYRTDLVYDINRYYPIANNEYAAPGYGLQKQPTNQWIMHWFAASGYAGSGAITYFSDPGWGGGTRSYDSTYDVVVADGGRGYIW